MTNIHATACRRSADRIEIGYETGNLDNDEAMDAMRGLALEYAAKCDGLEATMARRDGPDKMGREQRELLALKWEGPDEP